MQDMSVLLARTYTNVSKVTGKKRHNVPVPPNLLNNFHVLTKCKDKFECLVKEMLLIRKLKAALKVQSDAILAKVNIHLNHCLICKFRDLNFTALYK